MSLQYRLISKFYDLLDVIYFNHEETNPRKGILDLIPDQQIKILEVCTGTAANSIIIAENTTKVEIVGIDLSIDMLTLAKEKIEKKGIKNIKTLVMDATNMNFDDSYFDVILISLVLHEVDENTRHKIMNEARRVLKNKGKIIVVEWDNPKGLTKKFLFSIIKLLEPKGFEKFLKLDIQQYVEKFSLRAISEKKYDYTRIVEITKEE